MPPEDYLYDVFISYPRRGETSKWVEDHFFPALYHCLSLELDREPKIYFDKMLEQGSTWPIELGNNLASSRILLSLWTRNYLNSEWCSLELAHMLAREKENRLRTMDNPKGIISLPIIHDGDTIPTFLNKIQKIEIKS
ncbi:MAG: TIR domain-containing protein, partial [Bacteroidota bacterium]